MVLLSLIRKSIFLNFYFYWNFYYFTPKAETSLKCKVLCLSVSEINKLRLTRKGMDPLRSSLSQTFN